MTAWLTTLLSKRLAAAVLAAVALIQQHQYWGVVGVVIAYIAAETHRPTQPKGV